MRHSAAGRRILRHERTGRGSCAAGAPARAGPAVAASPATAAYRERIALPPDAVFEAVLINAAIADAPARELGRVRLQPWPLSLSRSTTSLLLGETATLDFQGLERLGNVLAVSIDAPGWVSVRTPGSGAHRTPGPARIRHGPASRGSQWRR